LKKWLWLPALFVCVLCFAQAAKHTRTADVSADDMTWRYQKNEFEFTGNCDLTITGPSSATMTSPKMTMTLTSKGDQIKLLHADGPLQTTIITSPDANGVKHKIVARCSQYATYGEENETIQLVGNAVADLYTLPESPDAQTAHFSGETIRVSLKAGEVSAHKAKVHVEGIYTAPEEEGSK
jgi:hypothetical protein